MIRKIGHIIGLMIALLPNFLNAAPAIELPEIGDPSGVLISPQKEQQIGEGFMRSARQHLKFVEDPEINHYIESLGYRLVSFSDTPTQKFTFFVIDNAAVNAFAVPGGFIGIHTGLIETTQNEDELAAVIAHEIAHITQRHLPRAIYAASQQSVPRAAALLAAILLGVQSPELAQAAIVTTTAHSIQSQINFTRANEQEADRLGMQTLYQARFNPMAMPDFFDRMYMATRLYGDSIPEFLRTHPVTSSRIADSKNRAAQLELARKNDNDLDFHLIKAKIAVNAFLNPEKATRHFASQLKQGNYSNKTATNYAYALSLQKAEKYNQSRAILQKLYNQNPQRITFILALGQLEEESGHWMKAIKLYEEALQFYPENYLINIARASAYTSGNQPGKAKNIYQKILHKRENDIHLYKKLADVSDKVGARADAHFFLAEYYYLIGNPFLAVDHLEQASKLPQDNFVKASRIDARLRQIKKEIEDSKITRDDDY